MSRTCRIKQKHKQLPRSNFTTPADLKDNMLICVHEHVTVCRFTAGYSMQHAAEVLLFVFLLKQILFDSY